MKTIHFYSLIGITCLLLAGCSENGSTSEQTVNSISESPNFLEEPEPGEKLIIYQMMTRLFGNTNTTNAEYGSMAENGVGTFRDINEAALAGIKDLGATHVWYTGVLEHATMIDQRAASIPHDDVDVVKGRAGSPYAIKDYYDVNPYLASSPETRMDEFEALVSRTHAAGLKVILDFVPNHVARSYASDAKPEGVADFGANDDASQAFSANNNFYYLPGTSFVVPTEHTPAGPNTLPTEDGVFEESPAKATGNDNFTATPTNGDWFETVKLNYGVDYQNNRMPHFDPVPDTWQKMHDILQYWAAKGVDGFRCDMAEMVPVAFWEWVIPQLKASHGEDLTFIAEIYNPFQYGNYLEAGNFDYLYDKVQMYDSLKHIIQGNGSTEGISSVWQDLWGNNGRMLRFLENHDEQRIASPDFAGNAWKGVPMMVVSATMHTGPVLLYFGQEVGEPGEGKEGFQGDDGRTTIFDFWGVPQHQKWVNGGAYDGGGLSTEEQALRNFYKTLLNFTRDSKTLAEGQFYDLTPYNRLENGGAFPNTAYAFLRHTEEETLMVVANFSDEEIQLPILMEDLVMEAWGLSEGETTSLRSDEPFAMLEASLGNEKLTLTLPAYGAVIIKDSHQN